MAAIKCKGVVFDLDGVITKTARVHAMAWEKTFNTYLKKAAENEGKRYVAFDRERDYLRYVDGKPRAEGVKSFLESRKIEIPYGEFDDSPEQDTVCGLGNRKNLDFQDMLLQEGPNVFDSSVRFIKELKKRGVRVGVASSSKNCKLILELAHLEDLFETRVDGEISLGLKLKGKPAPDIFVTAAANLGLFPRECVVVEDAISGVQAGRNGNFGLVLGVARNINGELLTQNGADVVVKDLSEINLSMVEEWFDKGIEKDNWEIRYSVYRQKEEKLRETLTSVGNGYLASRGCFEGERASDNHYPGTYMAGIYNNVPTDFQGRKIYNNDLVNCPNWTRIDFKLGNGHYISPLRMNLLSYTQSLNMREGLMERSFVCKDALGRLTRIHSQRIASMADPHMCAISYEITPLNYSEKITVRSSLDGAVINDGVARYRQLNSKHLARVAQGAHRQGLFLHMKTNRSNHHICVSAKTRICEEGRSIRVQKQVLNEDSFVYEELSFWAKENITYRVEKIAGIYTSRDPGVADPRKSSIAAVSRVKDIQSILKPHKRAWAALWDKADIRIQGDRLVQKITRLHIYHLLVTASHHNQKIDAGMPARGLHGEAYRGHIFWDEIFILPFYSRHFPDIAKSLLMFRYRHLDAARRYAKQHGHSGAMYPWQTADDGREETQEIHYNPKSGNWDPDLSRRQRHVSIAIFYNVFKYAVHTGDHDFLHQYGAEMMLEIARFWASFAKYDNHTGRYHIGGVMGPDEFHEKLPYVHEPGLKDNAYTNIMVVWLLEKTMDMLLDLPPKVLMHLKSKTGFDMAEIDKWKEMTKKINIVMLNDSVISQFDGYKDLKELDWQAYRKKYGDIHRMDRILKSEGDSPDAYKVAKQADVLMMFFTLTPKEVMHIFNDLGYRMDDPRKVLSDNYEYYERRTSHGSTLSKVVHAIVSTFIHDDQTTWDWFIEALVSDLHDTQGGTTVEGIHTGVMAGTVNLIVRRFAGISLSGKMPHIYPDLPAHWAGLAFKMYHRKVWYELEFAKGGMFIKAIDKGRKPIIIKFFHREVKLTPGQTRFLKIPAAE